MMIQSNVASQPNYFLSVHSIRIIKLTSLWVLFVTANLQASEGSKFWYERIKKACTLVVSFKARVKLGKA